jgi:DNA-directed RNA polymerase sigma subunit (sigma70/sigma32)
MDQLALIYWSPTIRVLRSWRLIKKIVKTSLLWLNLLPDLPRMVLMRRYGLDGRDSETLSAIGERLGKNREGVWQIQVEALRLVHRMVESERIATDAAILS